jgi:hypothetical protein
MAMTMRYTLNDFNNFIFNGFNYELPESILNTISTLSLEVGSPNYVKTPIFQKKDNPMKISREPQKENGFSKKKKGNKAMEVVNDSDWDALRTFQATKIEEKIGIDAHVNTIRVYLNKLTDKNYTDIKNKTFELVKQLILENIQDDITRISSEIFEIASTNRFYSKIYADLYSELITECDIMRPAFQESFSKFTQLFDTIQYVEPNVNYDAFCENNKMNEKRKSLAAFFINLMNNGIVTKESIMIITRNLLAQVYLFISQDNKKEEVDELSENIAILFKNDIYENDSGENYELINGFTISEIIEQIAKSKVKDYKSLTNKTIFKFMDMIDM